MPRRVFVALPLPDEIRTRMDAEVAAFESDMPEGVRILERETWHITILFLGDREEDEILKIKETLQKSIQAISALRVAFGAFVYGPDKSVNSRMIWCTTDSATSKALGLIKTRIEADLRAAGIVIPRDLRPFHGHITIARIRDGVRNLPKLGISFGVSFVANGLQFLEAHLEPGGATYSVIENFHFSLPLN